MMIKRLVVFSLLLVSIGACEADVRTHGHRLDQRDLEQIAPGTSSREDVARILGSPSSLASFDDRTWYYIGQRTEQLTFYQKELIQQDVLKIQFDDTGTVASVDRYDLADAEDIDPASDVTPTEGNEFTVIEQFLGNIGRFNPEDLSER
ncbi:MAG: outer membrane protein assembly factor BamE [Geminicoccaceae bacterium]